MSPSAEPRCACSPMRLRLERARSTSAMRARDDARRARENEAPRARDQTDAPQRAASRHAPSRERRARAGRAVRSRRRSAERAPGERDQGEPRGGQENGDRPRGPSPFILQPTLRRSLRPPRVPAATRCYVAARWARRVLARRPRRLATWSSPPVGRTHLHGASSPSGGGGEADGARAPTSAASPPRARGDVAATAPRAASVRRRGCRDRRRRGAAHAVRRDASAPACGARRLEDRDGGGARSSAGPGRRRAARHAKELPGVGAQTADALSADRRATRPPSCDRSFSAARLPVAKPRTPRAWPTTVAAAARARLPSQRARADDRGRRSRASRIAPTRRGGKTHVVERISRSPRGVAAGARRPRARDSRERRPPTSSGVLARGSAAAGGRAAQHRRSAAVCTLHRRCDVRSARAQIHARRRARAVASADSACERRRASEHAAAVSDDELRARLLRGARQRWRRCVASAARASCDVERRR